MLRIEAMTSEAIRRQNRPHIAMELDPRRMRNFRCRQRCQDEEGKREGQDSHGGQLGSKGAIEQAQRSSYVVTKSSGFGFMPALIVENSAYYRNAWVGQLKESGGSARGQWVDVT